MHFYFLQICTSDPVDVTVPRHQFYVFEPKVGSLSTLLQTIGASSNNLSTPCYSSDPHLSDHHLSDHHLSDPHLSDSEGYIGFCDRCCSSNSDVCGYSSMKTSPHHGKFV